MAAGEGRREVPDSEDEPMTSSPVNVSDGAADKLSTTAPVPPQDAQDALQEAARPHQATAEDIANSTGDRTDGLDADQEIASIDHDGSIIDQNSTKPYAALAELKPVATTPVKTDLTFHAPEVGRQCDEMDAEDQSGNTTYESSLDHVGLQSSTEATRKARSMTDFGWKPSETGRVAADSLTSGEDWLDGEGEGQPTELNASQDTSTISITSRGEQISESELNARIEEDAAIQSHRLESDEVARPNLKEDIPLASIRDHDRSPVAEHAVTIPPKISLGVHSNGGAVDVDLSDLGDSEIEGKQLENEMTMRRDGEVTPVDHVSSQLNEPVSDSNSFARSEHDPHRDIVIIAPSPGNTALKISERPDDSSPSTGTAASPQALRANANLTGVELETGLLDAVMDVHTSCLDIQSDAQTVAEDIQTSQSTASDKATQMSHGPTAAKSPQEITLAELKAQKVALLASLAALPAIQILIEENASSDAEMSDGNDEPTEADIMAAANRIVKDHIKLLHEYNELKDVGQGLMGLIADQRGVRIIEVQDEFGVDAKD